MDIPKHCHSNCLHLHKTCWGGSGYCMVQYNAKQAIQAEEDANIIAEIMKNINKEV